MTFWFSCETVVIVPLASPNKSIFFGNQLSPGETLGIRRGL